MGTDRRDVVDARWSQTRAVLSAIIATALAVWLAATWMARHTDAPDAISVGPARALLTEAYQAPVLVPGAEHVAVVAVGPDSERAGSASGGWAYAHGVISFGRDGLVAVDRRARHDGALVVWCPQTDRWEHPDGQHTYLRSGVRVSGDDRRHLGNLVVRLDGQDLVVLPGERLEVGPETTENDWRAVKPRCVEAAAG